jgi:signal transduction histidine kinase
LSAVERRAFRELAHELASRLRGEQTAAADSIVDRDTEPGEDTSQRARQALAQRASLEAAPAEPAAASFEALLDRIPVGVLVYRHDEALYANRHFLDLSGYGDLAAIDAAGGPSALIAEPDTADMHANSAGAQTLAIVSRWGEKLPVEGRMFKIPWRGSPAMALILTKAAAKAEVDPEAIHSGRTKEDHAPDPGGRLSQAASAAEFVAKISHEIRTPLTAITGFAEAIMTERFGPIGNEHYRDYIKDIHAAGTHLSSMLNDLFDLSKVEAGGMDLTFANVNLNNLTQQCVAIMQPQANRARVIIRTALTTGLPPVMADERALRQIVLGLLSNSIRFTGPGGQIIVSTVFSDAHEAVLRVRDTGAGMSQKDIDAALEPFREAPTSASVGSGAAGFSLPLTKKLAEANHAQFSIKSAPDAGTLVEIAFPSNRLVAA